MLRRTHLIITLFFVLLLLNYFENKIVFVCVAFLSTMIPDIDSLNSRYGRHWYFRPLQLFVKHRGVFHSFSFIVLIFVLFYFWVPVLAFPFLVGFGSHLIADCFTREGIKPFWPWRKRIRGFIRTGGRLEMVVLVCFIFADLGLLAVRIKEMFF